MDFAYSDEQRALATTVRDLLADRFGPERVRAVVDDPDGDGDPAPLWRSIAEQGWLAVLVPEEHGGLGLGMVDAQVVARAFGAGTIPGPWAATVLGGEAIRLAGSPEQQAAWLPRVAAGEVRLALATCAEGGAPTPAGAAVTVTGEDRLTGVAAPVEYGHVADQLVVADTGGGLWLVAPGAPGVTVTRMAALDRTTRLSRVVLQETPAQQLGGPPSPGPLEELYRRAAVLTAADLVGIARSALTRTVAYDRARV
ncbi:MAG: acyl-CoA dehydrogenase family protein, partial [Mycobacteriales bacterium]